MKKFFYALVCFFIFYVYGFSEENSTYEKEVISKIPYKSVHFTQISKYYWGENCITEKLKIWKYNDKIRSEKLDDNGQPNNISIIDFKDKKAYIYKIGDKKGMMIQLKEKDDVFKSFFGDSARASAKKVGSEMFNGENCNIYEYNYNTTILYQTQKYKVTEWRNKDGFVLKTKQELIEPADEKNKPHTIEVLSYKKNPAINNKIFEIPKDIVFEDQSNLLSIFSSSENKSQNKNKISENNLKTTDEVTEKTEEDNNTETKKDDNAEKTIQDKIVEDATKKATESIFNNIFGR